MSLQGVKKRGAALGELLSRGLQRRILELASEQYPAYRDPEAFLREAGNAFRVNVHYLEEHGLLQLKLETIHRRGEMVQGIRITAAGLDFLAGDGGLTAVLGVVTVKFHADTVKELLISKVEASGAQSSVKQRLIAKIKDLPAEITKEAIMTAAKSGIDHIPDIASWLDSLMRSQ